jgi:hypothetical protein
MGMVDQLQRVKPLHEMNRIELENLRHYLSNQISEMRQKLSEVRRAIAERDGDDSPKSTPAD